MQRDNKQQPPSPCSLPQGESEFRQVRACTDFLSPPRERTKVRGNLLLCLTVSLWFILSAASSQARINVVTLPGRDSVQLTIYNSADLTLVKETRFLTL